MPDSAQVRSELQVFLQKKVAKRVKNTLFNAMPTLDFMFSLNGSKKDADGLGRVTAGDSIAIGRVNGVSRPQRERLFREREYLPTVQISKPSTSEVKAMSDYDKDPTVLNWDTTNAPMKRFKQPRFKFARFKMPYKIPHSERRTAIASSSSEGGQAARAVGSVYDVEVKTREAVLCEFLNADLFTASGAPTDEDATQWNKFHSILSALKQDNIYGGVDRSLPANSWWRGNYSTAQFSGSFEDLIDYTNYDLGLLALGLGVGIVAVGKTLMKKAKAEAKANGYQLISPAIPDPEYGFKREIVCINTGGRRVFVYYEPQMDVLDASLTTNAAILLDPKTWTVAVHPDSNFKVSVPEDQTRIEGGDEADTGTIAVELMVACEVPKGNAVFTNVV